MGNTGEDCLCTVDGTDFWTMRQGWDPESVDLAYNVYCIQSAGTAASLKFFLSQAKGGKAGN